MFEFGRFFSFWENCVLTFFEKYRPMPETVWAECLRRIRITYRWVHLG
jgi:hypothetical protein